MKVRNDFVTNSSSSSFILGFSDEKNIRSELLDGFPEWAVSGFFGRVLTDVESAEKFDKDEVCKRIREEMFWTAEYEVEEYLRRRKNMSYSDAMDYVRTEEGKKMVEKYLDDIIENKKMQIDENSIFVEVEYSDHCNSELEHEIMPIVASTIVRISHH